MLREIIRARKPVLGLDLQRFGDDIAKGFWNGGIDFAKRLRFLLQALPECRQRSFRIVRRLSYY